MIKNLFCSAIAASIIVSACSFADDTELYLVDPNKATGKLPQVLFIFDNSGSMSTEDQNAVSKYCSAEGKVAGDCNYAEGFEDYLAGYSGYINEAGIYWNAGGIDNTSSMPVPDEPKDSRRFYADNNNCNKAAIALKERGRYTGYLREFKSSGKTGKWVSLAENEGFNQGAIVDCQQDILEFDSKNPGKKKQGGGTVAFDDGYPIDTKAMYTEGSDVNAQKLSVAGTDFGKGNPVTLYTSHYLVWYQWVTTTEDGQNSGGTGTRLEVAKSALSNALETLNIHIEASLAVFNLNYPWENEIDGGRIVSSMKDIRKDSANLNNFISLINGMPAQTNTPLCETLFEAHQYFSGGAVTYGNKDSNAQGHYKIDGYVPNSPPSIINSGNYTSPFKKCPDTAYVIYITDGAPTLDSAADGLIKTLTDNATEAGKYEPFDFTNTRGNTQTSYLPALASYMYNNDLVVGNTDASGVDNKQNVMLSTIGFSDGAEDAATLLEEAAYRGGYPRNDLGISKGYYVAKTGLALEEALNTALKSILSVDSSFTSPSIASNNFDKTQTYNSAYFAMFLPGDGPRWSGNLKKLKVTSSGDIVGPGGTSKAIDAAGNISASTCTYWNTCTASSADGNKVNSGGVLPALRESLKSRTLYTNNSSSLLSVEDVASSSMYSLLGSPVTADSESTSVRQHLDWLYGVDVDDDDNDENRTEARIDVMGDPLHSKPLAINFGASSTSLDVRILVGTNQGLVHMFKDSDSGSKDYSVGTVEESWAFIPAELLSNVPTLRSNLPTGAHSVYGMDLSPVAYTETDTSGKVSKAWVYLGMRRGGMSYYALDITNPDQPKFKWKIDSNTTGLEELGQTWSEPVVTFIPGVESPVLIFGGGMASPDGTGEAVYIVNADTGAYINKFTDSGMSSIPNKVAVLDSNNDGVTDRIYATDIGGNVWRMDLPSKVSSDWSVFQFASISASLSPNNRMFFAEPAVAQTQFNNIHSQSGTLSYQNIPYDAVTVGTGNRTNPLNTSTDDMFYVFQDRNVVTKTFSGTNVPSPLLLTDLYDVTSSAPVTESDNVAFGKKRGWYYSLLASGEKSLSASLIFDGKVYFTSFIPPTNNEIDLDVGVCGFSGQGRLYVFDLHRGTRTNSQLYYEVGERVPDTPQIVIPESEDGEESKAYIIGVGKGECENGECKGTVELGSGLTTNRIYYHLDESN
ncbi:type IV pilin biogenesis protein [Shewanella sp. Isolate13]|uniref:pilus assembly protein n=1 Tax=Shewanella sp. Isolate13 TaxID=2908531 RepID=UPI001EFC79E1|nr:PilC/PilY family type IV pilus protein [Shewanella sp. Isolate13]MCG9730004.1 type IV pilin biogenesis protein [Shewanella sp. Isolate13]